MIGDGIFLVVNRKIEFRDEVFTESEIELLSATAGTRKSEAASSDCRR